MDLVPTIDIGRPAAGELAAVDAACRDHGFFLLRGHGLDDLIDRTWEETRRFFAAPARVKETVRRSEDPSKESERSSWRWPISGGPRT